MSLPDFSPTVNEICKRIENKNEREDTVEELLGHLEDTYERNIATGKSEQDAYNAAIDVLGDRLILQQRLGAVHSHSPASQMKQTLWLFIFGFVTAKFISAFFTDSLAGINMLMSFFSSVCYFIPLLLMRNVNVRLKKAFGFCAASFTVDIFFKCINGFGIVNDYINAGCVVLNGILLACMWLYAVKGFMDMYVNFCGNSTKKKPHLGFALIYMPIEILASAAIYVSTDGNGFNLEGIIIIFVVIIYVFIIAQFVRLKNCLWDADARYGIESRNRKNTMITVTAVTLSFLLPMCFMVAYAVKDTPKTLFVTEDTETPREAQEVREHMLKLGMNKDVLALLPDSEVLNYKDAMALKTVTPEYFNNQLYKGAVYNFYFFDEEAVEKCQLRSLFVIDILKCNYRVGMYYKSGDLFNHLIPTDEKEVYVSILQKQGDKYYEKPPISCNFTDFYNLVITGNISGGFDFRGEENQTVLIAVSYNVWNYNENFSPEHGFHFVTQKVPLTGPYSTVSSYAQATVNFLTHNSDPVMEAYWFRDASMFSPEIIGQDYLLPSPYKEDTTTY